MVVRHPSIPLDRIYFGFHLLTSNVQGYLFLPSYLQVFYYHDYYINSDLNLGSWKLLIQNEFLAENTVCFYMNKSVEAF